MSIKVMVEVWESSSAKGGARLVLLALADHANDEGYCHPSVARLARKSALTERNVQLILRNLEARGELVTLHVQNFPCCSIATSTMLERAAFAKHLIHFRHREHMDTQVGDWLLEVVLVNSHDGSSSDQIMAGVYRLICSISKWGRISLGLEDDR